MSDLQLSTERNRYVMLLSNANRRLARLEKKQNKTRTEEWSINQLTRQSEHYTGIIADIDLLLQTPA